MGSATQGGNPEPPQSGASEEELMVTRARLEAEAAADGQEDEPVEDEEAINAGEARQPAPDFSGYNALQDVALTEAIERSCLLYELGETERRRDQLTAAIGKPALPEELKIEFTLLRGLMHVRAVQITNYLWPAPSDDAP